MADVVFATFEIEREIFEYKGVARGSYRNEHGSLTRLPSARETKLYKSRQEAEEAVRRLIAFLCPQVEEVRDHTGEEDREDGR